MEKADRSFIRNMIESLSCISEKCERGVQRRSYTPEYRKGVDYVRRKMEEAGLITGEDSAGNLFGILQGKTELPAILSGSHLDTVKCAGAFDGIAGVVCALEAARMIQKSGRPLQHPYVVFGTIEEEGSRFGQVVLGSKIMTGSISKEELILLRECESGETFAHILDEYWTYESNYPAEPYHTINESITSGESSRKTDQAVLPPEAFSRNAVHAVIELHGEQGAVLEREGYDIGVVDTIAGIAWLEVTVTGTAGHSGTVPMNYRKDAGVAASRMITGLYDYVLDRYAGKATLTAGRITLDPGSSNCIPGKCVFSLDIRSGSREYLQDILDKTKEYSELAKKDGCDVSIRQMSYRDPTDMSEKIRSTIEKSSETRGYKSRHIDSGAGHDSMVFAEKWPTGMIFLPNRDGISHHPDEYIEWEHLGQGAEILYDTIRMLDSM